MWNTGHESALCHRGGTVASIRRTRGLPIRPWVFMPDSLPCPLCPRHTVCMSTTDNDQTWVPEDLGFAERLWRLRKHLGLKQTQLADLAGLRHDNLSEWENGRTPRDFVGVCEKIADATKCDLHWLAFGQTIRWLQSSETDTHRVLPPRRVKGQLALAFGARRAPPTSGTRSPNCRRPRSVVDRSAAPTLGDASSGDTQ